MPSEILDSLRVLYSEALNSDRFRRWRLTQEAAAKALADYVVGEIFWSKSIGRPNTSKLSAAFVIDSWRTTKIINGGIGGALHAEDINVPHVLTWWDGKDDGEHWRVNFLIPNVPFGHRKDPVFGDFDEVTFIVPTFAKGISWTVPGEQLGIHQIGPRTISPSTAALVKENGPVYISFDVIRQLLLSFDSSGVANP
jgi:hypothetical protein